MSAIYKRGLSKVEANLTPMIDMTFLLIVFFVLVSQVVDNESADLELPRLTDPASEPASEENRAVINVLPGRDGATSGYRLASRVYGADAAGLDALGAALLARFQANPGLNVNLRADQATDWQWVEPAMRAVSTAARQAGTTPRINLVVGREPA